MARKTKVTKKKKTTAKKKISPIHESRIKACQKWLKGDGIEAYLISNRADHYYMTGFTGEDSAVLITQKAVWIISDGRFETSINQECPWAKVTLRTGSLADEIGMVCQKLKIKELSIQTDYVTVAQMKEVRSAAKPTKIVEAPSIVNDMRLLKDPSEVKLIQKSIKIAQDAFRATCKSIKVGQTEKEMAARLEYEMAVRGSWGVAFPSIVAEGPNAALPHAVPGNRKVKKGSALLFDWGATTEFYRSDLTRCVFVGSIPRKIREIYTIVLDAQLAAIDAIKPGVPMCEVDAVARDHIKDAGYGDFFGHGLGHGLGCDTHEAPSLRWSSKQLLEEGMVVTVEPGIYLPGTGGVRIEDDVLVTAKGRKVLSSYEKDIESMVL